jgi:hypothetical protein
VGYFGSQKATEVLLYRLARLVILSASAIRRDPDPGVCGSDKEANFRESSRVSGS